MTKWIVVFQVTGCYDTAPLWPGWISAQWDLLSGDSGWLLYQFCTSQAWLVGRLLFPAASLTLVLRNSFLPLQAPIQLGRGHAEGLGVHQLLVCRQWLSLEILVRILWCRGLGSCSLVAHPISLLSSKWVSGACVFSHSIGDKEAMWFPPDARKSLFSPWSWVCPTGAPSLFSKPWLKT